MTASTRKFVAYYRVPAQPNEKFGLGLEPQRIAMMVFLESRQGELVDEFIEMEGECSQTPRPSLEAALDSCRLHHAALVIARLGSLARDLDFVNSLMTSGVPIAACDLPRTNLLELHRDTGIAREMAEGLLERTMMVLAKAQENGGDIETRHTTQAKLKYRPRPNVAGP